MEKGLADAFVIMLISTEESAAIRFIATYACPQGRSLPNGYFGVQPTKP